MKPASAGRHLVLVGLMGVGKTTVGKVLAGRLVEVNFLNMMTEIIKDSKQKQLDEKSSSCLFKRSQRD